ncbi:MAG: hypothetical protein RL358_913 [Pseudomonadota bacterium]|jgi:hypothetical protein
MSEEKEGFDFKKHGIWLAALGAIGFLYNLVFKDVSVNGFVNIGLMDERRNLLLYFGLGVLVGVIFISVATIRNEIRPANNSKSMCKCPFCAEFIDINATLCKHCKSSLPAQPASTFSPINETAKSTYKVDDMLSPEVAEEGSK